MNCPTCGKKKKRYYGEWCPLCDQPVIENQPHLNFVQCLDYLEANGHPGIKDRMWQYCMDSVHNGTSFILDLLQNEDDREDIDEDLLEDLDLIQNTFNITTNYVYMDVSW